MKYALNKSYVKQSLVDHCDLVMAAIGLGFCTWWQILVTFFFYNDVDIGKMQYLQYIGQAEQ